ncbi:DinB family protein [Kribbella koreensis]|uniref:DinB family protein n=1 Tax=Kribbella koreensis TaxID=57909 RepID=UPI0031D00820
MTEDALVLEDVRLRGAFLCDVRLIGAELHNVEITGDIQNVSINGVDIGPLIDAELDRRDPDRVKVRPSDPDGFRAAWDLLEQRWDETVTKARALPPDLLHESVDGEWSFIETLRHLAFATDAWIRRAILGDPTPWHPLDLPWDEMDDTPGIPRDRAARPSLDEALALRTDRMATVRQYVDQLTDEQLAADTTPLTGAAGWPRPISYPVRECLHIVLNEEYMHRLYAERDLAVLAEN